MPMLIRSQKIYLLREGVDAKAALDTERFHAARMNGDASTRGEIPAPDEREWEPLSRDALTAGVFNGRTLDRVALTTDAGVGKSTNLKVLQYDLSTPGNGWAPIIPIGALESVAAFPDFLRDIARNELAKLGNGDRSPATDRSLDPNRILANIERIRDRGRLTLLFDGLDQAGDANVAVLQAITAVDGPWQTCRIVVAGRPFALDRHWKTLFEQRDWRFVQLAEFDERQQRLALGKLSDGRDRFAAIPPDARSILRTPRVIEYLRDEVPEKELSEIKTVSDVFWRSTRYMLLKALGQDVDVLTWQRYMALLGALAFSMYAQTETDDKTGAIRPNLDRVAALDMPDFLNDVLRCMQATQAGYTRNDFTEDLKTLSSLNVAISHGFLDVKAVGGVSEDLLWRDPGLQEFFAAYWATRWGVDTHRLQPWVVDPLDRRTTGFYWFWRYASEMPDEAIRPGSKKLPTAYVSAMTPLYLPPTDQEGRPIRSTEFIYRSWDRMDQWGGQIVDGFRQEFGDILNGKRDRERQQLAGNLLAGFIPLCEGNLEGDTGSFTMGAPADEDPDWDTQWKGGKQDNPQHEVRLSKYRLHRYCVTNLEYELFDPRHRHHRWYGGKPHPDVEQTKQSQADDRCPVVMVSWYDAWCFAKWLGPVKMQVDGRDREFEIVLPSEAQWEYACRAKRYMPFTFGEGDDGTNCHPELCNFNGNYPFPSNAPMDKDEKRRYRERTIPVKGKTNGGQMIDRIGPNRWGFYQMHGNVWEWCEDWYSAGFYDSRVSKEPDPVNVALASARVLRGGGWVYFGRYCRSAYRSRGGPSVRYHNGGFRLAAVPGAKPGK